MLQSNISSQATEVYTCSVGVNLRKFHIMKNFYFFAHSQSLNTIFEFILNIPRHEQMLEKRFVYAKMFAQTVHRFCDISHGAILANI